MCVRSGALFKAVYEYLCTGLIYLQTCFEIAFTCKLQMLTVLPGCGFQIVKLCLRYITYDPNYNYDEDDDDASMEADLDDDE